MGQILVSGKYNAHHSGSIDISSLKTGIYLIQFFNLQGRYVKSFLKF
jgi:hypothetical protein